MISVPPGSNGIAPRARTTRAILVDHGRRLGDVETLIGRPPNEATGDEGAGLLGVFIDMRREHIAERLEREERAKSRQRLVALLGIPSLAVAITVMGAALKVLDWLATHGTP